MKALLEDLDGNVSTVICSWSTEIGDSGIFTLADSDDVEYCQVEGKIIEVME